MGPREGGSPAEQSVTSDLNSGRLGSALRARKEEGSLCSAAPPPKYWCPCPRGAQDGKQAELWPRTLRLSLGFALGPAPAAAVAPASGTSDSSGREESSPPHKSGPTAEDKQFLRESHVSPAHLCSCRRNGSEGHPTPSDLRQGRAERTAPAGGIYCFRLFCSSNFVLCLQTWARPSRCETLPRNLGRHGGNEQRLQPSPRHPGEPWASRFGQGLARLWHGLPWGLRSRGVTGVGKGEPEASERLGVPRTNPRVRVGPSPA